MLGLKGKEQVVKGYNLLQEGVALGEAACKEKNLDPGSDEAAEVASTVIQEWIKNRPDAMADITALHGLYHVARLMLTAFTIQHGELLIVDVRQPTTPPPKGPVS